MKDTLFINLFGGPCAGKSTTAAALFANLKSMNLNVELITEFAKDLTWENSPAINTQMYVTGNQIWKEDRLNGKVDIIVTDSPIILSNMYYNGRYKKCWRNLTFEIFNTRNNWNFFINNPNIAYGGNGRSQTKEQASKISKNLLKFLRMNQVPFIISDTDSIIDIVVHDLS